MVAETVARAIAELVIMLPIIIIALMISLGGQKTVHAKVPKSRPDDAAVKPQEISMDYTAIGYKDSINGDVPFVIPERDRQNIGVFGEIGSGKTSVLRLLIMQDIRRKRGFMLIDPHREFAREVLSMIPPSMQDRVVYMSLASIYQFGKTICINPLETHSDHETFIRVAGTIDSLKQYFTDGWGPRLETVIRNMANLVLYTKEPSKFLDIIKVLFDENHRMTALQKCDKKEVRDFWENVFPNFPSEAVGAIYNKFDKIINTPPIAAMFNSVESTINIKDIIEDNKILIVDLGSGATTDLIEFVGTLLINLFSLENRIRFDLGQTEKTPFNLYIDEVHMFSPSVIRDLLNNTRKYGMKVTIATQSVKVLDSDLSKELDDLLRCMIMFRCDSDTAKVLEKNLPLEVEQLSQLDFHKFAAFSQGNTRVQGIGKTKHVEIPNKWKAVAKASLETYGKTVDVNTLSYGNKKGSIIPKLSPLEYFLLNTMYIEKREINHSELVEAAIAKFSGVDERAVNAALIDVLMQHNKFVVKNTSQTDSKKFKSASFYSITKLAIQTIYSRAYAGRGAGSEVHRSVISLIAKQQINQYHYCVPDLGDTKGPRADLVIHQFRQVSSQKSKEKKKYVQFDPTTWSPDVLTVEVETDPTKHKEQVFKNYQKNELLGMKVWFVVFEEKHKDYIIKALTEKGISEDAYMISVMKKDKINEQDYEEQAGLVSGPEAEVLEGIGDGYATVKKLVHMTSLSPSQVMACIENLEGSGKITKSGVVRKKSEESLVGAGTQKSSKAEHAYSISEEITQKAKPYHPKTDGAGEPDVKTQPGTAPDGTKRKAKWAPGSPPGPDSQMPVESKKIQEPMEKPATEPAGHKVVDPPPRTSESPSTVPSPVPDAKKIHEPGKEPSQAPESKKIHEPGEKSDPIPGDPDEGEQSPPAAAPKKDQPDRMMEHMQEMRDGIDDSIDNEPPPDYTKLDDKALLRYLVDPKYKDRDLVIGILGSRGKGVRRGRAGQPILFDLQKGP